MRSSEEQLSEIMKRSEKLVRLSAVRRYLMMDLTASCAVVFLIVFAGCLIPRVSSAAEKNGASNYGGLILSSPYTGYVVIGVLAFVFGVLITLLCLHLKDLRILDAEKRKND